MLVAGDDCGVEVDHRIPGHRHPLAQRPVAAATVVHVSEAASRHGPPAILGVVERGGQVQIAVVSCETVKDHVFVAAPGKGVALAGSSHPSELSSRSTAPQGASAHRDAYAAGSSTGEQHPVSCGVNGKGMWHHEPRPFASSRACSWSCWCCNAPME